MGFLTFCVVAVAFTGLVSGAGVLPDSVEAAEGDTVMFTISLPPTQTPFTAITWSFGTKSIITSSAGGNYTSPEFGDRITLFISTGSLELRNVALTDTGEYRVNIIPADGAAITGITTLNIYERVSNVRVTVSSSDLVEFISSVTLSCSASGSSLSFLWLNGSDEVTASDRVSLTDGNLTISTVRRSDQGPFRCQVSNPVSNSSSETAELSISYGPDDVILETSPQIDDYEEGSDVLLSCSADSRPAAHFQWLFNGELLSFTGAQLELVKIQMNQSGNYSCQAFNNKTLRYTTSEPGLISVLKRIMNISVESSSNEPMEGSSVNISCDASGSISIRKWLINGQELKPSENIVFYEQKRVLSFKVLNRTDSGTYVCEISNSINSETVSYSLHVNYGPENVQISGPKEIQEDKTFKLSCFCDSVPTANYTWIKNGTILAQSSEYTKESAASSDSGQYICKATNEITKKTVQASHTVLVTGIDFFFNHIKKSFFILAHLMKPEACGAVEVKPSVNPVTVGQSVTLSLSPPASLNSGSWAVGEALILTWTRLGDQDQVAVYPNHLGRASIDANRALTLSSLSVNDSGVYTMKSTDPELTASVSLIVLEPISNVTLSASDSALIEHTSAAVALCSISSGSSVSLAWFNSSSEVTASDRVRLTEGNSTLTIVKVNRYDRGPFTCSAFNPVSNATSNPVNFTIYYGPDNMNLTLGSHTVGSNVTAVCSVESHPPAQMQWVFKEQLLNTTGSELELYHVTEGQSGSYSCFAFNNETNLSHNVTGYLEIKDAKSGSGQPDRALWFLCLKIWAVVTSLTFSNI
ncbi:cell adhesion molecule CEACAM5-like [Eucyclogobius newberryi]|uniref:cell adhesion molecule CEACAM5-like n=1 Tax=Eucyclogobius newberryi TaxID=166745 RepID=UPI003B5B43DD